MKSSSSSSSFSNILLRSNPRSNKYLPLLLRVSCKASRAFLNFAGSSNPLDISVTRQLPRQIMPMCNSITAFFWGLVSPSDMESANDTILTIRFVLLVCLQFCYNPLRETFLFKLFVLNDLNKINYNKRRSLFLCLFSAYLLLFKSVINI